MLLNITYVIFKDLIYTFVIISYATVINILYNKHMFDDCITGYVR